MLYTNCEDAGFKIRDGFHHCNYCGSLEPVELAELINEGKAIMRGSDWKYGYPHKFYVDVLNPHPDKQVVKSSRSWVENGEHKEEVEYGPKGTYLHFKFYSNHLALLDRETFEKVAPIIGQECSIANDRWSTHRVARVDKKPSGENINFRI